MHTAISSTPPKVTPFSYGETEVRIVLIAGEPWFVLSDLCKVLGLGTPARVRERLDEGVSQSHTLQTAGGAQQMTIVSEPGMYEVVIRSDKPEAAKFRRWITGTVLPEIRKTGSFNAQPPLHGPELIAAALLESQKVIEQREARIFQLENEQTRNAPKVAYVDTYVADEDCLLLRTVASNLGVQEKWLRDMLIEKKWIYPETTTRFSQSKGEKVEITRYSAYADKRRYFRPIPAHEAPRFRGEVMHTLKVTPQGAEAIARLVSREVAA